MSTLITFDEGYYPNGTSSGDVTQTSAVLWTRSTVVGTLTFQVATDETFSEESIVSIEQVTVSDPVVPVKVLVAGLDANQQYFYRAIDAEDHEIEGSFKTSAEIGTHDGFHFGVGGDWIGELTPYVSITNAATADLDLFIKLGDTIYADLISLNGSFFPDSTTTLSEFQAKHSEVYSSDLGLNAWAALQATTPILSMIDDHEVIDNFAGGADPSTDPRFDAQPGENFINETALFTTGLEAFNQYNAIEDRTYSDTGDDRFDGAPDLYRYNTYGSDAAIIMVDQRSFRDEGLSGGLFPGVPPSFDPVTFIISSFDSTRTMLGDFQLTRLEQDLLDARDNGITWKFVMLPEPIQNNGPGLFPEDRYEGYAAERNALLQFIDDNHIENVVFVSSDAHWLSVNNLTYQETPFGPQIESSAIDITTMAVGTLPIAPQIPPFLFPPGHPLLDLYNSVPIQPDSDDVLNDKDDFVKLILNDFMTQFGYDPIGLSAEQATLLQGDYFVGHSYGWSDFNIDGEAGSLTVTTYGVPWYSDLNIPSTTLTPSIVSQFELTPVSNNIVGTAQNDALHGTNANNAVLGAAGDDVINGGKGNDFVDGGEGSDRLFGDNGEDILVGGPGKDFLLGGKDADVFKLNYAEDSKPGAAFRDVILDFKSEEGDTIDLQHVDGNVNETGNQDFEFIGTDLFSSTAGELRYSQEKGFLLVAGDSSGDGLADFEIQLQGPTKVLVAEDFLGLNAAVASIAAAEPPQAVVDQLNAALGLSSQQLANAPLQTQLGLSAAGLEEDVLVFSEFDTPGLGPSAEALDNIAPQAEDHLPGNVPPEGIHPEVVLPEVVSEVMPQTALHQLQDHVDWLIT